MIKTRGMLGKKVFFTTFYGVLWFAFGTEAFASDWERVQVRDLIALDHYVLTDGRQIQLAEISALDWDSPAWAERCLTESSKLQLERLLADSSLKLKKVPRQARRKKAYKGEIRFGKNDLAHYLLSQGLAQTKDDARKTYQEAQAAAQAQHRGRWGQCNPYLNIKKWEKQHGRTEWFWKKYHTYLEQPSIGRVSKILAGNLFELDNGLRVRLQGVDVPMKESSNQVYQCFASQSQVALAKLIRGQKVYLNDYEKELTAFKTIERQVYLPATNWRPAVWINAEMISNGFGKLSPSVDNDRLKSEQEAVWQMPNGAWESCLRASLK